MKPSPRKPGERAHPADRTGNQKPRNLNPPAGSDLVFLLTDAWRQSASRATVPEEEFEAFLGVPGRILLRESVRIP